ncbi:MAG: iron-sulfur cluster repair di-iron protein [Terracidiphilus sp.]
MPTSTQSILEIVTTQPSAAKVFHRFDIDLCSQAEKSLDDACAELQLSVDQVLEKLSDAATQERGGPPVDLASLSIGKLIQHIVRVHHHYVRQELPRLAEMAQKLAAKRSDRAPELKNVVELLESLRADMFAHIQKEELILFPFIVQMEEVLLNNGAPAHACFRSVAQPISMMMQEHESANHIVAELRRLTVGFEPPEWACATHVALFSGLSEFESDLKQHVHLENDVLFPRAIELEAEQNSRG